MLKLMRAPNALIGQHWVNLLTVAGIPCELHNRYLHGALGEIPAEQCSPELWLIDERDAVIARTIIERGMAGPGVSERALALQTVRRNAGAAVHDLLAMRDST